MPVVKNKLKGPTGADLVHVRVRIRLVPDPTFVSADDYTVEGVDDFYATGEWSKVLVAQALCNPPTSYYAITEQTPGGSTVTHYISVPNTAGPFFIEDILVTPPEQATVHELDTTAHPASSITFAPVGSIVATNVQDAIVEAASEAAAGNHNHAGIYEPAGSIAAHEADTTNVHGIVNTAALALTANVVTLAGAQTITGAKTFEAAGPTVVAAMRVAGDTFDRWLRQADGREGYGPGNAATDTFVSRTVDGLQLEGSRRFSIHQVDVNDIARRNSYVRLLSPNDSGDVGGIQAQDDGGGASTSAIFGVKAVSRTDRVLHRNRR